MSRAVSISWVLVVVQLLQIAKQVRFAQNIDHPVSVGNDFLPLVLNDGVLPAESLFLCDYPIPLMRDELGMEGIAGDVSLPPETFMPLEYPLAKPVAWKEKRVTPPSMALPMQATLALPAAGHSEIDSKGGRRDTDNLDNLLLYLRAKGLKVKEVKHLSEDATRITLDDLLGPPQFREPELVKVR